MFLIPQNKTVFTFCNSVTFSYNKVFFKKKKIFTLIYSPKTNFLLVSHISTYSQTIH